MGLAFTSCNDMFEEKKSNEWDTNYVWSVSKIAEGVLYNAYSAIPNRPDNYGSNFLDAATDNALTNQYSSNVYKVAMGGLTPAQNLIGNWSNCFKQLQYINSFLENGLTDATVYKKEDPELDAQYKQRLRGEALFLRAYWSFKLLQMYGGKTDDGETLGYPLKMHFITEEEAGNLNDMYRSTYQDCADQIMRDCDDAEDLLPEVYTGDDAILGKTEIGRPTQGACKALKSIVALYAASPAFSSATSLKGMGQFDINNHDEYISKWKQAALIANDALNSFGMGVLTPLTSSNLADTPADVPFEFLMFKYYNSNDLESRHFAPYYWGKANTVPSQNLVDAFPMKNGYPIDMVEESGYDSNNPYENRDNRFYLNIYAQGMTYGNTGLPVDVVAGGKDAYDFNQYASKTGYYLAKYMSKNEQLLNPVSKANVQHYYPVIRKTEVWLNYAEAANEAWGPETKPEGCLYSAYDVIKMIREQSGGITDHRYLDEVADEGKDAFRKLIQNERRIELAFENHRFFDMRRWVLPLDEPVRGVVITKDENGNLKYDTTKEIEPRRYNDIRYYYTPIPYDECVKNPNMKNNLGW